MAKNLFGEESKPAAIILTHGHFDHVGALESLLEEWNVPVYAHEMELPYLTGKSEYPPADPTVGGGLMSTMSCFYPTGSIDIVQNVKPIPFNEKIAELPEWKFIYTPGHSPGHISLFRERDKVLIAGDAFVTTKAESVISTVLQTEEISGPPKYLTCNWASAKLSVLKLSALQPEIVATGHGNVMKGAEMRQELDVLSRHFDEVAVPIQGRYINEPAVTNADGVVFLPQKRETIPAAWLIVAGTAVGISLGLLAYSKIKKQFA
jgi:glyoxylase-like metal-dependent hydrolase (beta-lactamase superfamily II)